jgi:hypothetical protein
VLTAASQSDRARVSALFDAADRLGLVSQPAPEPLPSIDLDDIHLGWTVILPSVSPLMVDIMGS